MHIYFYFIKYYFIAFIIFVHAFVFPNSSPFYSFRLHCIIESEFYNSFMPKTPTHLLLRCIPCEQVPVLPCLRLWLFISTCVCERVSLCICVSASVWSFRVGACRYLRLRRRTTIPVSKKILTISPKTLPHTNANVWGKSKPRRQLALQAAAELQSSQKETRWDAQKPSHNSGPRIVIDTRKAMHAHTQRERLEHTHTAGP